MSIAEKNELKREWGKKESCRQQIQTSLGGVLKNGQYLEEESRFDKGVFWFCFKWVIEHLIVLLSK